MVSDSRHRTWRGGDGVTASEEEVGRWYRLQLPLERRAVQGALRLGRPRPAERVLDVATGTAALLVALAGCPHPPTDAVGVDVSRGMLAAADPLPTGYDLEVADARALPFAEGSFDVVFAVYLLHLLEPDDRRQVVGEMARVLRPGGRAVTVTVWHLRPRMRRVLQAMPRRAGLNPHDPTADLEGAGLAVVERCAVTRGYPSLILGAVCRRAGGAPPSPA